MKKILIVSAGVAALALPLAVLAAGVNLYNGGLGQVAGDMQNFGVAVCNGGAKAVTQAVPVTVAVGGQTATVTSASSIQPKACAYSYLTYGALSMRTGKTYSVTVTIDPVRTLISNSNNQTVYSITVPGAAAALNGGQNQTANVNAQSGDFFSMIKNWFSNLFGGQ